MPALVERGAGWRWGLAAVGVLVCCIGLVAVPTAAGDTTGGGERAAPESVVQTTDGFTVPASVVAGDRPDPPSDRLGWENGVWANATLDIDQSDGITEPELEAVVARTMARVESIRGVEFDRTPPVRILHRAEHVAEIDSGELETPVVPSEAEVTAIDAAYEALFLLEESESVAETRRNIAALASGYYSPSSGTVTMISANETVRQIREGVLSQELFHAQQDSQFGLPAAGGLSQGDTIEQRNTNNTYIEGDANYVQALYEQRCEGVWSGTCYRPVPPRPDIEFDRGVARLFQQPYNSGFAFVSDRHEDSGWAAVDELYEEPPASTEQVIHPGRYGEEMPVDLRVEDRSADTFQPLRADGERVVQSVGEPGLYVALLSPTLDSAGNSPIVPFENHRDSEPGLPNYRFDHPATDGWAGDRLLPYVSTASNETGFVYETAWDTADDAREFHDAYRRLLAYHGAESVSGLANTYRLPERSGFGGGVYLDRTGGRLRIVNAPSVEQLPAVHDDAAPPDADRPAVPWERVNRSWELTLEDADVSRPAVSNGTLYLTDDNATVYAIDRTTGQRTWQTQVGQRITSPLVVSNGTVYAGTARQGVVALRSTTGDIRWGERVGGPVISPPRVADGTVYVRTTAGQLRALAATDGVERWSYSPVGARTVRTTVAGDTVVVATNAGRNGTGAGLSGIDPEGGERTWRVELEGISVSAPAVSDGTVYDSRVRPESGSYRIGAVDLNTGERRWSSGFDGTAALSLTAAGGLVYAAATDARGPDRTGPRNSTLVAIDGDGNRRWSADVDGALRPSPAVSNGTVYVGSSTGAVAAFAADSGQRRWRAAMSGDVTAPLVATGERLYAGSDGGVLSALNATSGTEAWAFVAPGLESVSPTVVGDTVYTDVEDSLYALTGPTDGKDGDSGDSPGGDDGDDGNSGDSPGGDDGDDGDGTNDDDGDGDSGADEDDGDDGDGTDGDDGDGDSGADEDGAGFGVVVVAVAVLGLAALARRLG